MAPRGSSSRGWWDPLITLSTEESRQEKPRYCPVTLSCLLPPAIFRAEGGQAASWLPPHIPWPTGTKAGALIVNNAGLGRSEGLFPPPRQACVTHGGWDSAEGQLCRQLPSAPLSKPSSYLQAPAAPAAVAVPGAPRRSPPVPGRLARSPGRPH